MSAAAAPLDPPEFLRAIGWTASHEDDLESFQMMLRAANREMNLVGAASLNDFRRRHFYDSAQLLWFSSAETRVWADLGSGAGLPGLVLAIALKGRAGARVHLIESVAKKCRFLEEVIRALELPAEVHNARAESLRLDVEIVTARACAPLTRLLYFAQPYISRRARGLFLKGEGAEGEIAEARRTWVFDAEVCPSLSDSRGRVISIGTLACADR